MAYPFPIESEKFPKTMEAWQRIPPTLVLVTELIPVQYYLRIDRVIALLRSEPPEGNDFPLVVKWIPPGKLLPSLFIYDGHHRWTLATIRGTDLIYARIAEL